MITTSLGSHRFESGPTIHYNGSDAKELAEIVLNPQPTIDYVNKLPGVNTTPEEIAQVAAAGIVRLAVEQSEYYLIPKASKILLDACSGATDGRSCLNIAQKLDRRLDNAVLDSASVLATRKNEAGETAKIIRGEIPKDEGIFIIGLANGGFISTAQTFLEIGEGDHALSFVRYSRRKCDDTEPNMYPYPDSRIDSLRRAAKGRHVVIHDEDYGTGETLRTAVSYFSNLFGKSVLGIAPVEIDRRIKYNPLVIRSE